jgi:hypothetical protein
MYARNVGEALSPIEFLWSGWCPVQAARAVCCTNPHPMGQQHIALRTSDGAFALARLYASCDEAPFFPASRRSTTSFRGWAHTLMVHRRCVSMRHSITGYGMVNISAWSRYACLSIQRNLLAWRRGRPLTPLVGDADGLCHNSPWTVCWAVRLERRGKLCLPIERFCGAYGVQSRQQSRALHEFAPPMGRHIACCATFARIAAAAPALHDPQFYKHKMTDMK